MISALVHAVVRRVPKQIVEFHLPETMPFLPKFGRADLTDFTISQFGGKFDEAIDVHVCLAVAAKAH